ncbi:unnamed protein product [Penicillium bialowiezense]
MEVRMRFDDRAWIVSDKVTDSWPLQIHDPVVFRKIGNFLLDFTAKDGVLFTILETGGFNIALQMEFERSRSAIIRFPLPGAVMFPEEKLRTEVAAMRYIGDQTSIPVPLVIHSGTKKESPMELAPFIIMEKISHSSNMLDILLDPNCPAGAPLSLDPSIPPAKLEALYKELAGVCLSLCRTCQSKIGSLVQVDDFTWTVGARPVTLQMNELVRVGTLPRSKIPTTTFDTASSYFDSLAELHIAHLMSQRNDSIFSADDCRSKFVARFLFRKLIRDPDLRSQWIKHENGPFPVWDLTEWSLEFESRLPIFLKAMADCEDEAIQKGRLSESQRLSNRMKQSWESGDFWIVYAATHSFAVDAIYWAMIDKRFFGPTSTKDICAKWKERLHLLDAAELALMEEYVELKLSQMETRALAWDPDQYTLDHIQKMDQA